MANFITAAEIVAINEGGYTDNPKFKDVYVCSDGSWVDNNLKCKFGQRRHRIGVNHGVAAPTLYDWYGRLPSVREMKNLPLAEARAIFKANYWSLIRGDEIVSQAVANIFFDAAIHMGVRSASMLMQLTCNDLGSLLVIDYVIGPNSIATINSYPEYELHEQFKARRIDWYEQHSPKDFLPAFIARVKRFQINQIIVEEETELDFSPVVFSLRKNAAMEALGVFNRASRTEWLSVFVVAILLSLIGYIGFRNLRDFGRFA